MCACVRVASATTDTQHPCKVERGDFSMVPEGLPTNVGYCSGEVSKQEDGQTYRQTYMQTDRQTAQDWVVATRNHNTKIYL